MTQGDDDSHLSDAWWADKAKRILHPVQVQIIEVLRLSERPLEAVELAGIVGHQRIAYHLNRLLQVSAVTPAGTIPPPRGGMHVSYQLVVEQPGD
jgi:hypothetical protein